MNCTYFVNRTCLSDLKYFKSMNEALLYAEGVLGDDLTGAELLARREEKAAG